MHGMAMADPCTGKADSVLSVIRMHMAKHPSKHKAYNLQADGLTRREGKPTKSMVQCRSSEMKSRCPASSRKRTLSITCRRNKRSAPICITQES